MRDKILIGNIYRPPKHNNNNTTMENFSNEFTPVISKMAKIITNIIITGEFNIDLLQINERVKFHKYFDLFVTNGSFPLVTLPTRSTKQSSSLSDQMFCKVKRTGYSQNRSFRSLPILCHSRYLWKRQISTQIHNFECLEWKSFILQWYSNFNEWMGYGKWPFCWPERQLWSLWKNNPGCQNQASISKKSDI